MKTTKITWIGIALGGLVVYAICDNAWAQQWQEPTRDSTSVATDWEQRVLKQPQSQQPQWRPSRSSNVSYEQPVRQERAAVAQQPFSTSKPHASNKITYRTAQRADANNGEMIAPAKAPASVGAEAEVIPPGEIQGEAQGEIEYEQMTPDGPFADANCSNCGDCGGCDQCCGPAFGECCEGWEVFDGRCGPWLRGLSVFAGVDGFKGPQDRGTNGNFGLNEGINLARPLGDPWGFGYQIGANFVQSDFSGVRTVGATERGRLFPVPYRKQYFATAGIFRRADPCRGGFQGGIAYDYLYDMYNDNVSMQQVRSETGFVLDSVYEIGYYGAYGVGGDRKLDGKLEPTDMFVLFIRRNFENGGDGRIWGGATGNGDGLIGVDLWVPLGKGFALENRVNYLIPGVTANEDSVNYRGNAQTRESWGFMIQLVWYPGQNAKCQQRNPYRPMFNVADNSLFMVDRMINQTDVAP